MERRSGRQLRGLHFQPHLRPQPQVGGSPPVRSLACGHAAQTRESLPARSSAVRGFELLTCGQLLPCWAVSGPHRKRGPPAPNVAPLWHPGSQGGAASSLSPEVGRLLFQRTEQQAEAAAGEQQSRS